MWHLAACGWQHIFWYTPPPTPGLERLRTRGQGGGLDHQEFKVEGVRPAAPESHHNDLVVEFDLLSEAANHLAEPSPTNDGLTIFEHVWYVHTHRQFIDLIRT